MSDRYSQDNRFWKKKLNKRAQKKESTKFHAALDSEKTLTLYQRDGGLYLIIKKDLLEYSLSVAPSEAPIINQFLKRPDPFESLLADINIVENEIEPINLGIQTTFGEEKEFSLISVKLAVGSGENDYVTIDESDLFMMDVEPTLSGLIDFINSHESVIGLCDRLFIHEKGNIIILEAKVKSPDASISSIELKILSNLQQRGLYLQKKMQYAGVQLYLIIKAEKLSDSLLSFLKSIEIDWEVMFLRRDLAIEDWLEVECEKSSVNLKGYLASKFDSLGFFDINNVTRVAVVNQLNFKIVTRMAELLNNVKEQRYELDGISPDSEPLNKAEIIAAARLSCAYFGVKKEIKVDKEIDPVEIQQFEAELVRL
jgi:hypothetical protein